MLAIFFSASRCSLWSPGAQDGDREAASAESPGVQSPSHLPPPPWGYGCQGQSRAEQKTVCSDRRAGTQRVCGKRQSSKQGPGSRPHPLSPLQSGRWAKLFPRQMTASKPPPGDWGTSLSKVIQLASSMTGTRKGKRDQDGPMAPAVPTYTKCSPASVSPSRYTGIPYPVRGMGSLWKWRVKGRRSQRWRKL